MVTGTGTCRSSSPARAPSGARRTISNSRVVFAMMIDGEWLMLWRTSWVDPPAKKNTTAPSPVWDEISDQYGTGQIG